MTSSESPFRCEVCVVGFIYFELHVPALAALPPPGEERFVGQMPVTLGGALNTASVARRLGMTVSLMHPGGEGLTDVAIQQALQEAEVTSVRFAARSDPALSLVVSTEKDRALLSAADFAALAACPALPSARWVHVPGLREARLLAPRLQEARAAGARIAVSGSFALEELAALASASPGRAPEWDLLVLNEREAQVVAGSVDAALERLSGVARDVVVTAGARGARGWLGGQPVHVDAAPLAISKEAVEPTGAGDAFCAGLLAALSREWPPDAALSFAARVAARILGIRGGAVLGPGLLDDLSADLTRPAGSSGGAA